MSLFGRLKTARKTPSTSTPPKCNVLIPRWNFQKRTGLVTSGPVAAATSKPLKFERADSVKGWSLTDCSPQHLVDAPVETGESLRSMKIQWLVSAAGRGRSEAGKKTRQSESFGSFCRANAHADSFMGISGLRRASRAIVTVAAPKPAQGFEDMSRLGHEGKEMKKQEGRRSTDGGCSRIFPTQHGFC